MNKKRIALITGGYSGESVISYKSAKTIKDNLDRSRWEPFWIDICKDGWFYVDEEGKKSSVDKNDFSISVEGHKINFDAALIALHGTPGEDGKLQGYLDDIGIPYTSCDATTSAITFNKRYTVAVAAFSGIAATICKAKQWRKQFGHEQSKCGGRLGSGFGQGFCGR